MAQRTAQRADGRLAEIAGVAADALEAAEVAGPALVCADPAVGAALASRGVTVVPWSRWAAPGVQATPWPPQQDCVAGVLRLPGGWDAFQMSLHALCARLPAGAPLWIYGGSEEGIVSVPNHLDGLVDGLETVALKRRTRVLRGVRIAAPARGGRDDWRSRHELAVPGLAEPLSLTFFPGCFAHGRLDPGSQCLLEALPPVKEGARVLDFACGTGVIAAAIRARTSDVRLTLLDADALALQAAAENLPDAEYVLSDGVAGLPGAARFDLIVSNPPIHRGRQEDFSVLAALLTQGPKLLRPKGALVFVAQRTAGVGRLLADHPRKAQLLKETPAFQVWRISM